MYKIRDLAASALRGASLAAPSSVKRAFGAAALFVGLAVAPAAAASLALVGYGTGFAATQAAAYGIAYNFADGYIQAGCSQGVVTGEQVVNFNYYWNGSSWVSNVQLAATCVF